MISKCLFLVGGYGTRFLPASKAIPKEMLPILDKPLLQYGVEEACDAGLKQISFVTGRGKRAIEDHFDKNLELDNRLAGTSREEDMRELQELISSCTFVYTRQGEMLGTGHAVLSGQILIGNEPFAVVLPDDLCIHDSQGVLAQLVDVYEQYRCCVVAVQEVPQSMTDRYGIIDATLLQDGTYKVRELIEKPSPEDAPSQLAVVGRYILIPEIFSELRSTRPGHGGEIQLTDALSALAREDRVVACKFKGVRFDCGSLEGFVEATNYCFQQRTRR